MEPVKAGVGAGREERIAMNRNVTLKNGRHWTIRHGYPSPPEDEVAGAGPVDSEIGVLRLDRANGQPLAVLYNFACHLLFGNPQGSVTANFPGIASRLIEESFNGALAFFLQGAAGDVIDVGFKDFSHPRDIEPYGVWLGQSTLQVARAIRTGDAALSMISETIELPRRTDIPERIAALRREQSALLKSLRGTTLDFNTFLPLHLKQAPDFLSETKPHADLAAMRIFLRDKRAQYREGIATMERLAKIEDEIATFERHQAINAAAVGPIVAAEVQGVKIGECVFVTAPLEVLTEVGLNIKRASPYEHTFVAAFTNGYLHYGAPAEYYDKGSYEVTECFLAPQWQKIYEAKVDEIIRRL
jgi:hypothetical protein